MRRSIRIALEVVAPPAVAVGLGLLFLLVDGEPVRRTDLGDVPSLLGFAYILAGLPSILFAIALEHAFARWFDPRSTLTVLLAAALGALGGLSVNLLLRNLQDAGLLRFLAALGATTGAVVGTMVVAGARLGARERRRGRVQRLRLELP